MVDKIIKLFRKISSKERQQILSTREAILQRKFDDLDVKKLSGHRYVYRVRVRDFRIIFRNDGREDVQILDICRRDEDTYKGY